MQGYLAGVSEGTRVLLILSVILFAGFIMTRLTNTLNLPKVSGYIMAGILIGPCGLNLIPVDIIGHMGFVSDLALAFIAFGVGKFFKKEVLQEGDWGDEMFCDRRNRLYRFLCSEKSGRGWNRSGGAVSQQKYQQMAG